MSKFNTESKLSINLVAEFGINGSNSVSFFTNSRIIFIHVRQSEYLFNLTKSECFSSNSVEYRINAKFGFGFNFGRIAVNKIPETSKVKFSVNFSANYKTIKMTFKIKRLIGT